MEIRTTRELALRALIEILEMNKYTNLVIDGILKEHEELSIRERAFVSRLIRGTVERKPTLDGVIDSLAKPPTSRQKPYIRNLLRMSSYQILFMDGIRDAAAINEAVALSKKHGFAGLSGFINGVLRNIARDKDRFLSEIDKNEDLAVPDWIEEIFTERFGAKGAKEIEKAFLMSRPACIRITDDKTEEIITSMEDIKITKSEGLDHVYLIEDPGDLRKLPGFEEGKIYIQDEGAIRLLCDGVKAIEESGGFKGYDKDNAFTAIDVCAAPGGKAIHLAHILKEKLPKDAEYKITAGDISENKVRLMEENIRRSGLENIDAKVRDALKIDTVMKEKADLVICDLPCSGLGVIGRKPDIKYRLKKEDIEELAELQENMLEAAKILVKPGHYLLYATCTLTEAENEGQIESFLAKNENFKLLEQKTYVPTPKNDGFFMSLLQKAFQEQ